MEPSVAIPVVRLGLFFNTQDEIQLIKVMNQLETQKMSETIRTQIGQLMDEVSSMRTWRRRAEKKS